MDRTFTISLLSYAFGFVLGYFLGTNTEIPVTLSNMLPLFIGVVTGIVIGEGLVTVVKQLLKGRNN